VSTELLAMLAGSASGFIFKLIGSLVEAQKSAVQGLIKKQGAADASHDAADKRGGAWIRRFIVTVVLFAVVVAPFLLAHSPEGITVGSERSFLFFNYIKWETLGGYVILPEIRQTLLAIVGFYFGSSQIK